MNKKFTDFMNAYAGKRMAVAVSGGVDSICLLHWLVYIRADVVCLHVNHGLRAVADTESEYVRDLCAKLSVPCHIFYWTGDKPSSNLEDAARNARYEMMTRFCRENNIDYLITAHQADDQIETFLMNLGRGSGLYGLAAMRGASLRDGVTILRPLLGVWRADLQKYCDDNGIKYFSDEMNMDVRYTRVRIRQNRRAAQDALGISDARILLAVENLSRTRDAIDEKISEMVRDATECGRAIFSDSFLFDPAPDVGLRFLGTMIQAIGGDRYQPRLKSLQNAMDVLRGDCKFTLGHCTVRRLGGKILIVKEGQKTTFKTRKGHEKKYKKT